MSNPYNPSAVDLSSAKSTNGAGANSARANTTGGKSVWTLLMAAATVLLLVIFLVVASILIPQALQLSAESAGLPARLQSGSLGMVRASWIGGLVAIAGAISNMIVLVLIRKGRIVFPIAVCAASVVAMVVVAILFKPT
ncbi:MAG: hypothetical protein IT423_15020 [Pirellulaceae bacterium]|nr:hypothetical protein [Pirellulaceae bacterium]